MSKPSKAANARYVKALHDRKAKLQELSGETAPLAFQRVRLIQAGTGESWLTAYDKVIAELEAQKESK